VTEVVDLVYSAAIDLWIEVGSAYETALNNGVSHCIEHMLFKGSEKRSEFDTVYGIKRQVIYELCHR